MTRWFLHPWLKVRAPFALGLVFLVAALAKISDPPGFAKSIWMYQLAPAWSIHPVALVLPWLELLCGLALCLGLWTRAAASWIAAVLLVFIVALAINLARQHSVDCGCFGTAAASKTEKEQFNDMQWTILRDVGLLLLAIQVCAAHAGSQRKEA